MIDAIGLSKTYAGTGRPALNDVSLQVPKGAVYGILGRSGAGKSTLIRCLNLLERPTSGRIIVNGNDITRMDKTALREYRLRTGMIFQHFNLLHARSVADNIAVPLEIAKVPKAARQARVAELLELVGLADKAAAFPSQLSGGQKQRVGIARALSTQPKVLLCDEATSALDPQTTASVLQLLAEINRELKLTIVLITHEMDVIRTLCDRVAVLEQGKIIEQGEVWQIFGNPQHEVTRSMTGTLHHARPGESEALAAGRQVVTLHFDGSSGREPNLQQIAGLLGAQASLLSSSCEHIQGRTIGQIRVRLAQPLDLAALRQHGWVADRFTLGTEVIA